MARHVILRIDSYEGDDTFVQCGDRDGNLARLYCVVALDEDGQAEIVDSGHRSIEEAELAWPDAKAVSKGG